MIEIDTRKQMEMVDITKDVERSISGNGRESGICLVYSLHTTTALIINEADDALIIDILISCREWFRKAPATNMIGGMAMPMLI